MELTIDDKEMRDMVKEVVVEMIKENREGFVASWQRQWRK